MKICFGSQGLEMGWTLSLLFESEQIREEGGRGEKHALISLKGHKLSGYQ